MTQAPDIIILNGRLITFDPARPFAQALAVTGGTIAAVGTTDEIRALAGPATRVVDAAGATVLPGFIDSHVHLFIGSVEMGYASLTGVSDRAAATRILRQAAADSPQDRVVVGVGADYFCLGGTHTPTRQDLDAIVPDRPLAILSADHHTAWANTAALTAAGLLQGGRTDPGSEIVMGPDGLATGELLEPGAFGPVLAMSRHGGRDLAGFVAGANPVPAPDAGARAADRDAIARGLKHCAAQGITSLHNMDGNFYQLELLEELDAEGRLACRTEVPFHLKSHDPLDRLTEAAEMRARYNGPRVWSNRVKMFMDGVIDSRTALMLEPYPGTDHLGDAVFEADHFNEACRRIDAMGLQIAVHAIGDAGIRRTLDGFQAAREANGIRDSRHRIEHLEVIHPDDLPRLKELDVVASIQPGHAPFGGIFPPGGAQRTLHPHQIPWAFAWQRYRDAGIPVIFSTDWPVIGVEVMPTLRAAIAPIRLGPDWRDETQGLMDTLASYTRDNAWVEFNEHRKGRLVPGYMADIAVLSHDLTALPPDQITQASCMVTICDGVVTHEA